MTAVVITERLACPFCAAAMVIPAYGAPTRCDPCDRTFVLIKDYGWFSYTLEHYAPES